MVDKIAEVAGVRERFGDVAAVDRITRGTPGRNRRAPRSQATAPAASAASAGGTCMSASTTPPPSPPPRPPPAPPPPRHGVAIERIITDNDFAYTHSRAWHDVRRTLRARHL